jgi:hypothetical protein
MLIDQQCWLKISGSFAWVILYISIFGSLMMRLITTLFYSLVLSLGISAEVSAASYQYDFTIFGASGVVSFSDISDGTRSSTGLEVTSNLIDPTGNAIYSADTTPPIPSFEFAGGLIVDAIGRFEFGDGINDWSLEWFGNSGGTGNNNTSFGCIALGTDKSCGGQPGRFIIGSGATNSFVPKIAPVPLPAGLPLLLAGLGGLAGLRLKKKHAA